MAESYHAQITEIIMKALIEQDSNTYHGLSVDTKALAEKTAGEVLGVVAAEEKERKQRELLNPSRGVVIVSNRTQGNPFYD